MQTLELARVTKQDNYFKPHVPILVENARYLMKTVDQVSELEEAFLLRGKIFAEEYGVENLKGARDVDAYDYEADHLIIIDKRDSSVVGTYRMLCSRFTKNFYSQSEFQLDQFLREPGTKLELGRACIAKEHRRGAVISLLWRGIVRYAIATQSEFLFGCSSVKTESALVAKQMVETFKTQEAFSEKWEVSPLPKFQFQNDEETNQESLGQEMEVEIPALFQCYLNAGAQVLGQAAYDPEFHCIDFFTVLRLSDLTAGYEKRYFN